MTTLKNGTRTMTDAREQVIAGLEAAIRDINCPLQYSPLMMEAARLLRKFSRPEPTEPHPRWKPSDKSERHPKSVEEWDTSKDPVGEALDRSRRRLNVAGDYDDPRAPPQMALVLRGDITRLMHDWVHKNAVFEIWVKEREDVRALSLQEGEWQDITTADRNKKVWLFTPAKRLGPNETEDDIKFAAPRNWTWATMWMPAHVPEPPTIPKER